MPSSTTNQAEPQQSSLLLLKTKSLPAPKPFKKAAEPIDIKKELKPKTTQPSPPPAQAQALSPSPVKDPEFNNYQNLYKTELCRSFLETGTCRYGWKCQFAHGEDELRPISRHPKYKTEICKTFHTIGTCPYGTRCRFIHREGNKPAPASPTSPPVAQHSTAVLSSSPVSVVLPPPMSPPFMASPIPSPRSRSNSFSSPVGSPCLSPCFKPEIPVGSPPSFALASAESTAEPLDGLLFEMTGLSCGAEAGGGIPRLPVFAKFTSS